MVVAEGDTSAAAMSQMSCGRTIEGRRAMKVLTMKKLVGAPGVGDTLPNGALVLDSIIIERDTQPEGEYHYGFVLAWNGSEFVVWRLGVKPDGSVETWNGNYQFTIQKAVDVFGRKVREV